MQLHQSKIPIHLPILLVLLAACGRSNQDQARKLRQEEISWQATTRLTADLRANGAVPAVYARQALEAAEQELEKIRRKAGNLSE